MTKWQARDKKLEVKTTSGQKFEIKVQGHKLACNKTFISND